MSDVELISIPGLWAFHYNYFAGANASRFFKELKEKRHIMGTRCPGCRRVLVPARGFCDACMQYTNEWIEVGPAGTLETFTIIATQFPGLPKPPLVMAYVTLDGADTALINVVTGMDLSDIEAAAVQLNRLPRVRTRYVDDPKGRITDFSFELV